MKVKSLKSVYLTKTELKEAIILWLKHNHASTGDKLAAHIDQHACDFDWSRQDEEILFVVDMDGVWENEDNEYKRSRKD